MNYHVQVENGHIIAIYTSKSEGNVTKEEYDAILEKIEYMRTLVPAEGYHYELKADLTIDIVEDEVIDETITDES